MTRTPSALLEKLAPWLLDSDLGVCVVGSSALREACKRAGIDGPNAADLDLSWALDVDAGTALLHEHGVFQKTTEANRLRGTVALKTGNLRIEITAFRSPPDRDPSTSLEDQIHDDLAGRDMTIGALAHWLTEDRIVDPFGGLQDWQAGRVVPVGDPAVRIREHPIRWLRYFRRAHQWGFELDPTLDRVALDPQIVLQEPTEAIAGELRAALLQCRSPGEFLRDLHAYGLLAVIAPELDSQFDGRAAGPIEHHPEGSQANHLILALEWIVNRTAELPDRDHLTTAVAVLCHDLGKGLTPKDVLPSHRGHEHSGVGPLRTLLGRYPSLTDSAGRRLAETVCRLHLTIRNLEELRAGTRAWLYRESFNDNSFRVDLFALAIGADSGGRQDRAAEGDRVARSVQIGVEWMRSQCAAVDVASLYQKHKDDKTRFETAVHEAYADALRGPIPR